MCCPFLDLTTIHLLKYGDRWCSVTLEAGTEGYDLVIKPIQDEIKNIQAEITQRLNPVLKRLSEEKKRSAKAWAALEWALYSGTRENRTDYYNAVEHSNYIQGVQWAWESSLTDMTKGLALLEEFIKLASDREMRGSPEGAIKVAKIQNELRALHVDARDALDRAQKLFRPRSEPSWSWGPLYIEGTLKRVRRLVEKSKKNFRKV